MKSDSKMFILMVILRVITITYSHRALIINFSLHFCFLMVNYWGGMIVQAIPPPKILGGLVFPPLPPPPPGIDTQKQHLTGRRRRTPLPQSNSQHSRKNDPKDGRR